MFRGQISEEITSTISMACRFTTKSGGMWIFPVTPMVLLLGCLTPIHCRERHAVHHADDDILNRTVMACARRQVYANTREQAEYALLVVIRLKSEEHNRPYS
jgi:hypothetical protein